MPVQKRAINPPQFAELLDLYPVPAWVEDASGHILARNAHASPRERGHPARKSRSGRPGRLSVCARSTRGQDARAPSGAPGGELRLVAVLPTGREMDCLRRIISAFPAKTQQTRQVVKVEENPLDSLTPQQREIYRLIIPGRSYSCKEIAAQLDISHNTVLNQIWRMRNILGEALLPRQRQKRRRSAN